MAEAKKLAIIGFSGLSGATQVGINYVAGADISREQIIFIFYGKTEAVNPGYLEELKKYGVESCFARKKAGAVDPISQFKILKLLLRFSPKNVFLVTNAPFLGVLLYKLLSLKSINVISIEQHPLAITSFKEYLHSSIGLIFYNYMIPASKPYAEGYVTTRKPFSKIFAKKIVVIPNGLNIPLNGSVHANGQAPESKVVLGMAARFDHVKDYETVIRAVQTLNKDSTVKFIFKAAGDGPNRAKMENLVKELGLEERVQFLGMITKEQIKEFYESLDIYIQSTEGEVMSFSMMEAMGYGKVFIGTNVRGVQEFVEPGENGYLFEFGNVEDLISKIREIQQNPWLVAQLSRGARAYYEKFFSLSAMVGSYSRLMKL